MAKKRRLATLSREIRDNPSLFGAAIASVFVMGLGQLINRQWRKALLWFAIPLVFVGIELGTSGWLQMQDGYAADPVQAGETQYSVRDYGGFFTKGVWSLISLGNLVSGDSYRGLTIEATSDTRQWTLPDNSSILLARGLIAIVGLMILGFFWIIGVVDAYSSRRRIIKEGKPESFKMFAKRIWSTMYVYIMITPAIVLILFFTLIPFLYTFLCGFTNWTYKIYLNQDLIKWTGFEQYGVVFGEPGWLSMFLQVFGWTAIWAVTTSFTVYALGFANALVVESPLVKGKKIWRSIMIIPWALPAMVSLLAFRNVFDKDGLMNQILFQTGLMKPVSAFLYNIGLSGSAVAGKPDDIIYWFDPSYNGTLAKFVCIMVNLWLGAPYFMMLITGVMSSIPRELYEAAHIDGASGIHRFRYITFPLVMNATIPAMIMTVTFNFNNFGGIYFLTGGGPTWDLSSLPDSLRSWTNSVPGQTDILISWIYKISFNPNAQMFNKAAVYTLFVFLILGIFSVVQMKRSKAFNEEGEG
jgi:arabinogalactan oligomer / maltooligosaccharide transport system permease protein